MGGGRRAGAGRGRGCECMHALQPLLGGRMCGAACRLGGFKGVPRVLHLHLFMQVYELYTRRLQVLPQPSCAATRAPAPMGCTPTAAAHVHVTHARARHLIGIPEMPAREASHRQSTAAQITHRCGRRRRRFRFRRVQHPRTLPPAPLAAHSRATFQPGNQQALASTGTSLHAASSQLP